MTKRDFDRIARAISSTQPIGGNGAGTKRRIVRRVARAFGEIFPFFDQAAFEAAAMGEK